MLQATSKQQNWRPNADQALPTKKEILTSLAILSEGIHSKRMAVSANPSNESKASPRPGPDQQSAADATHTDSAGPPQKSAQLRGIPPGAISGNSGTGVEYGSKPYWSNISAGIEELLVSVTQTKNRPQNVRGRDTEKEKELTSAASGAASNQSKFNPSSSVQSSLPEWDKMCLLGQEDCGLCDRLAVCDMLAACSAADPAVNTMSALWALRPHPVANDTNTVAAAAAGDVRKLTSTHSGTASISGRRKYNGIVIDEAKSAVFPNIANANPATEEADGYMFKIGSHWSFVNQRSTFSREGCTQEDLDAIAASYIASAAAALPVANAQTGSPRENASESPRMLGWLRGRTTQGTIHVRPLCTPSDVTIAMREMSNPDIFEAAYVQMPFSYQGRGQSGCYSIDEIGTFYRFTYTLNGKGTWMKLRRPKKIPAGLVLLDSEQQLMGASEHAYQAARSPRLAQRDVLVQQKRWTKIREFLCPHLHYHLFDKEAVEERRVLPEMRRAGLECVKSIQYAFDQYNKAAGAQLLTEGIFDFEELRFTGENSAKANNKFRTQPNSNFPANPASLAANAGIAAPNDKFYRLFHIVSTKSVLRVAQQRRDEVHSLSSEKRLFLQHFGMAFEEEFTNRFLKARAASPTVQGGKTAGREAKLGSEDTDMAPQPLEKVLEIEEREGEWEREEKGEVIPTHDTHALIHHKRFRVHKMHTRHSVYNQAVTVAAAQEALKVAESLWQRRSGLLRTTRTKESPRLRSSNDRTTAGRNVVEGLPELNDDDSVDGGVG
jgi:hypothetical protein